MAAKRPESGVVDRALANLRTRKPAAWWHNVDPKHQQAIDDLMNAWLDGRLGSSLKAAAEAISKTLGDLGIAKIGFQGVQQWLKSVGRKA